MNMKEEIISRISAFPTMPIMVSKLLYVLNDQESASSEVCKIIQYDPALTANVLKAANSSYLGFRKPVGSLSEATFRLGTKWIFQIAVSSLIYANLKRPARGYELSEEELWRHSLSVALMSESLRHLLNIKDAGFVYTAALIHDMGKIVLGDFVTGSFDAIQDAVNEKKIPFEEAEEMVLGIDHAEIGAHIAENWKFPQAIIDCIRWHHNPQNAPEITPAIDLVHIADSICLMEGFGIGRDDLQYRLNSESATRLNLNSNIIELATGQVVMTLEDVENIFKEIPTANVVGR
jgi:putative nucleotidyltransferase with HDIG domain